ncbi:divalent-cation tolerance protein CutA [Temperatibacter marinus]|uniref:Divalent-cation tolerance protein CutA n=1 Tax=Temperatibacter marinus TaxID=1456591 RepID=A0AA52H9Z3_9PROT|nr:divalent-cation tolerance protein CutA [Temperatibacter marinus]WND02195.1 divalent-cation tolerance protein CutA [Temperatibacter marinus]
MEDLVTLYVTFPNHDDASRICTHLVSKDIIACANLIEGGQSLYKYDGVVNFEDEVVAFMKTHKFRVQDAIDMITELHSYKVPCITQLDIQGGHPDYLKWVSSSVSLQ